MADLLISGGVITMPKLPSFMASSDNENLVTIPNVELFSTGIEYPTSTGPVTLTEEDIADFVTSQDDPAIKSPRLKIGHIDPRFDGEPALGKAINARLSDDGQSAIADYVGVPKWLAEIMPTAYPSRSIEGRFAVETETGHKWRLVVDAVALLGIMMPGITTIEDLPIIFSAEGPDDVEVIAASIPTEGGHVGRIAAAANIEDVRRAYYDQLDSSQVWWWIRALYLEPNELIVDDDDGTLYRVPFEIDGDDITFSEPIPVQVQYVDKPETTKAAQMSPPRFTRPKEAAQAVYASRGESRPTTTEEVNDTMDPKRLRESLGLAEDASDEDVLKRAGELRGESPEDPPAPPQENPGREPEQPVETPGSTPTPDQPGAPGTTETPQPGEAPNANTPTREEEPVAASSVTLDPETYAELRANASMGAEARRAQLESERNRFFDDAVKAGKFPPARRSHYEQLWAADPQGTRELIEKLAPGIVPTEERGTAPAGSEVEAGYDPNWLAPAERQRLQAAEQRSRVTTEV